MLLQHATWISRPSLAVAACLACTTWCSAFAAATAPWHADLPGARTASAASQRPVLAVFVASWSEESRGIATALQADAGVNALLSACFEPVVLDVDGDPELTRRLEVSHVPTAVVLDAGDRKLAAFECPNAAPAFITAAAQAARDVSTRQTAAVGDAPRPQAATPLAPATHEAATRGSISMLTAKVRQLSSFAADGTATATAGGPNPADLHDSFAGAPAPAVQEPTLPRVPPTWTAERATAPLALAAPPATTARPTIEPVAQGVTVAAQPSEAAPNWLATAGTSAPETSASISDMPSTASDQGAAPAVAKPATGIMAAIQKPFAGLVRKPEAPPAKPETPPTMPPARPQWPGQVAAAPPTALPATTAASPTAEATMPLGLEGYCPVTLAEKQVWTEGRPQYGARHRGRTYLFAGPEQQKTFLADPDRYAPALSGDDPVLAFEQGKSMPGQRRYGVVCQSRMYLFASPATRDAFAANPDKYAGRVAMAEQGATASTRTY